MSVSKNFFKKFVNHWSKSTLISIMFWIVINIKCFITKYFINSCSSRQIFNWPYHVESKLYLVHFDKYILKHIFFYFFSIFSLFLVNCPQALYVNPDFLKCILGINLSLTNKSLFRGESHVDFRTQCRLQVWGLSLMTFWNSEKWSNFKVHELSWPVIELCTCLIIDEKRSSNIYKSRKNIAKLISY